MLTENVPVARNRSVWRTTFRRDPQTIHLPDVNLAAVVAPKNVAALAIIVVVADVLDMPIVADRSVHDGAFGFDPQAIHLPDVDRSAVVTPEKVALPIAVEVADALDVPVVGDWRVRHAAFGFDRQAIHLPEVDLSAVVAPENVVVAVAVEVAGALNVPVIGNWSVRHAAFGFDPQAIHLPEIDLPAVVAPENAALAVAIEVVRDVAHAPDRCHHVVVGDHNVAEGKSDAAIGQQGGLGAVPGKPVGYPVLHGELDADLAADRVEPLRANEIGEVVLPGHEEAAVGQRDHARLVLSCRRGRVDQDVGGDGGAGVRQDRRANVVHRAIGDRKSTRL